MTDEFKYYVVFSFIGVTGDTRIASTRLSLDAPIESLAIEEIASSLAPDYRDCTVINWKRVD